MAGFTALIVFLGGYIAGKAGVKPQPAKEIVKIDTKEHDEWRARAEKAEKALATFQSTNQQTTVVKWKYRPNGTLAAVEQSKERVSSVSTASHVESSQKTETAGLSTQSHSTHKLTVYAPVRPWSVGVLGGLDLRMQKHWGLVAGRDFGPVHLGIWALPSVGAGGAVLRLRF